MDSFISWIGGKRALRDVILPRFPPDYDRYIEVFGGAAWILFHKVPEAFEVYNDYNNNLSNLFSVVKNNPLEFFHELGWLPHNSRFEFLTLMKIVNGDCFQENEDRKSEHEIAKRIMTDLEMHHYLEIINHKIELKDVRRAVNFYKLIRYSYASGCTSFSCQPTSIVKTAVNIWKANRRLNLNGSVPQYGKFIINEETGEGVVVENKDFEALICQYDRETSFFYCDPPYYQTEKHYEMLFSMDDHYRLRDTLYNINGKFMVSYNDCDFIRDLYKCCQIKSVERINNISQRHKPGDMFREVIITNYDQMDRNRKHPVQMSLLDV